MARKVEQRLSYCLAHQDRLTDTRCAACLKPICEECTLATEMGKFCGEVCYQKRLQSNERVAEIKAKDALSARGAGFRTFLNWSFKLLFLVGLYFLFLNLPIAWKAWLAKSFAGLWKATRSAFGH